MKKLGIIPFMATAVILLFSCNKESIEIQNKDLIDTTENSADLGSETVADLDFRTGNSSTVVIEEDPDGPPSPYTVVPGASSKLTRNANGISVNFKTKNLIPGNAYTLWFVIFGENPGPPVLVTYAAGHIVGGSGKANFSGHLSVGEIFNNPLTAEVHLALRTHGPAQPGMIPSQIHTMNGGCTSGYPSGPALYPDSDEVGYCANVQVAMHPAN